MIPLPWSRGHVGKSHAHILRSVAELLFPYGAPRAYGELQVLLFSFDPYMRIVLLWTVTAGGGLG